MRDLLDKLDQLNESTGLANRKPGDVFRNPAGEEIVFNQIQFYPKGGGTYSKEELDSALAELPSDVKWLNAKSAKTGGFAIMSFNKDGQEVLAGRYLQQVYPNPTQNFIPNEVEDYKFSGKAAAKIQAGLSPQDLLTDLTNQTIPGIMNQLAKSLGTDHPLYAVAHHIAVGEKLPMTFKAPQGVSFTGFRDYFGEILQPIALQKGQITGNAGEAAEEFLGGSFAGTTITWEVSKTAGLSDSVLTNDQGQSINLSSKGGGGAMASVGNLVDVVNKLVEAKSDRAKKLLKKYASTIELIKGLKEAGQAGAPLYLGEKFGVITAEEAEQIKTLKKLPPQNLANVDKLPISDRLKEYAKARSTKRPENVDLYYHILSAVAGRAATAVNEGTNFSKAATDILNNGALVQVYTIAKEGKDTWTLQPFETRYPSDRIKGVYLTASKTYTGTYPIKGNFTFKIDKGMSSEITESFEDTDSVNILAAGRAKRR